MIDHEQIESLIEKIQYQLQNYTLSRQDAKDLERKEKLLKSLLYSEINESQEDVIIKTITDQLEELDQDVEMGVLDKKQKIFDSVAEEKQQKQLSQLVKQIKENKLYDRVKESLNFIRSDLEIIKSCVADEKLLSDNRWFRELIKDEKTLNYFLDHENDLMDIDVQNIVDKYLSVKIVNEQIECEQADPATTKEIVNKFKKIDQNKDHLFKQHPLLKNGSLGNQVSSKVDSEKMDPKAAKALINKAKEDEQDRLKQKRFQMVKELEQAFEKDNKNQDKKYSISLDEFTKKINEYEKKNEKAVELFDKIEELPNLLNMIRNLKEAKSVNKIFVNIKNRLEKLSSNMENNWLNLDKNHDFIRYLIEKLFDSIEDLNKLTNNSKQISDKDLKARKDIFKEAQHDKDFKVIVNKPSIYDISGDKIKISTDILDLMVKKKLLPNEGSDLINQLREMKNWSPETLLAFKKYLETL